MSPVCFAEHFIRKTFCDKISIYLQKVFPVWKKYLLLTIICLQYMKGYHADEEQFNRNSRRYRIQPHL